MSPFKHLLAATDLSAPARHAAERAAMLAREAGATLDLIHVASLAPLEKLRRLVVALPEALEQQMVEAARNAIQELADSLRQRYGIAADFHVASGPVPTEIVRRADVLPADLIVLGAHGAGFLRHALLGSTAERMIGSAGKPILVVKQAAHEGYRKLLVPVDFSVSSLPAVRLARAIAPDATLVLLHVFEVPFEGKLRYAGVDRDTIDFYLNAARQDAQQRMQDLCDEAGLAQEAVFSMVLHGDPLPHIIEQEQEHDCDLIVMGKHGESTLEKLLLGSVTRHVLAESQCDVLVSMEEGAT
ncbi:MAG TPA: universal stress protein [Noviherbaspirillum sp.]